MVFGVFPTCCDSDTDVPTWSQEYSVAKHNNINKINRFTHLSTPRSFAAGILIFLDPTPTPRQRASLLIELGVVNNVIVSQLDNNDILYSS